VAIAAFLGVAALDNGCFHNASNVGEGAISGTPAGELCQVAVPGFPTATSGWQVAEITVLVILSTALLVAPTSRVIRWSLFGALVLGVVVVSYLASTLSGFAPSG
jgi:hypothetical protein